MRLNFPPLREVMTNLVSEVSQLCDLTLPSQAAFIGGLNLRLPLLHQVVNIHFGHSSKLFLIPATYRVYTLVGQISQ